MAVSHISSSSNKSTTTSVTVTAPASIQDGDILIAFVSAFRATNATAGDITAPTGWTLLAQQTTSTRYKCAMFWKRASSENGSYAFGSASSTQMQAAIGVYRGALASGAPTDKFSNTAYITSNTIVRAATITPDYNDGFYVWGGWYYLSGTIGLTAPSGMNSRQTQLNTNCALNLSDLAYTTAAASGDKDGTAGGTCTVKHAMMVALLNQPDPAIDLIIADNVHGHISDGSLTLSQVHIVTVAGNVHNHLSDNVTVTQVHILQIADNVHSHISDNVSITQVHVLAVNDNLHGHLSDNVNITQVHVLAINENVHSHLSDNVSITQVHIINVQENIHQHISEGDIIIEEIEAEAGINLIVQDNLHSHLSDNIDIIQTHNLTVNENIHPVLSDNVELTQVHILQINDNIHEHISDSVIIEQIIIMFNLYLGSIQIANMYVGSVEVTQAYVGDILLKM